MSPTPRPEPAAAVEARVRAEPDDGGDPPTARLPRVRLEHAQRAPAEVESPVRPRRPVGTTAARRPTGAGRTIGTTSRGSRTIGASTTNGGSRSNGSDPDGRVLRVAQLIRSGEDLTGVAVGEMFRCSARTGR